MFYLNQIFFLVNLNEINNCTLEIEEIKLFEHILLNKSIFWIGVTNLI